MFHREPTHSPTEQRLEIKQTHSQLILSCLTRVILRLHSRKQPLKIKATLSQTRANHTPIRTSVFNLTTAQSIIHMRRLRLEIVMVKIPPRLLKVVKHPNSFGTPIVHQLAKHKLSRSLELQHQCTAGTRLRFLTLLLTIQNSQIHASIQAMSK